MQVTSGPDTSSSLSPSALHYQLAVDGTEPTEVAAGPLYVYVSRARLVPGKHRQLFPQRTAWTG